MKLIIILTLAIASLHAWGQTAPRDGNWIKNGLDAYDRTFVTRNGSDADDVSSVILVSYVSGMLAVHRSNNLSALVLAATLNPTIGKTISELNRSKIQTTFFFAPLIKLPDDLSPQQIAAILRKLLQQNPARWSEPADKLITAAFATEFPSK